MKKTAVSILVLMVALGSRAQDKYNISLTPATFTFYCGIVNNAIFPISDANQSRRAIKFEATADGAQLDYDVNGRMLVLPQKSDFTISVYANINKQIYFVDKLSAQCKPLPKDDSYKDVIPNPQYALKNVKNFSAEGKKVNNDSLLSLSYSAGMISDLTEGVRTMTAVRISESKKGMDYIIPWWNYDVRSEDATVRKDHKQVYMIMPKPGVKKCTLSFFVKGNKVGEEQLYVRKKE